MRKSTVLVLAALLTGCTTPGVLVSTVDEDTVARVETAAARAGVKVYWMSKPQKSTATTSN